eukprot:scaffold26241_cov19-Tisochrysis_lutea.AAC.1
MRVVYRFSHVRATAIALIVQVSFWFPSHCMSRQQLQPLMVCTAHEHTQLQLLGRVGDNQAPHLLWSACSACTSHFTQPGSCLGLFHQLFWFFMSPGLVQHPLDLARAGRCPGFLGRNPNHGA